MSEEEIVSVLERENEEFKVLLDEHRGLKSKLSEFKSKMHLTPEEEIEAARIKKLKLAKKDKMATIIRQYKSNA